MSKLTDFMAMSRTAFWNLVNTEADACEDTAKELWAAAQTHTLSQETAVTCLDALFLHSHARIAEYSKALAKHYPTKQFTKNRLLKREDLWWTDHFTAGISRWSTLNWFSAAKRQKKSGKMGYAGASTHFVQGYHDLPFYIIPLMHGAWHEPRRNKDSISIEFVNCGKVIMKGGKWHYWARELPLSLVQELPPVTLDKPYRGLKAMQPFTYDQLRNAIVLKRIVIAALGDRMDKTRFSQHSDWRDGKTDMGPLWMFDEINEAAFSTIPVEEFVFVQREEDDYRQHLDMVGNIWGENDDADEAELFDNPEFGEETPTHDDDPDDDPNEVLSVRKIQQHLSRLGYTLSVDGKMGPETRRRLREFQKEWNKRNPSERLKVDGIPGPRTSDALKRS